MNTAQLLTSGLGHKSSVKTPCPLPGNECVFATGENDALEFNVLLNSVSSRSGSMDGSVMLWDTRIAASWCEALQRSYMSPVWEMQARCATTGRWEFDSHLPTCGCSQEAHSVRHAHKTPTRSRGKATPEPLTRHSVTAVAFIPHTHMLATAGSGDTCVKLWDLRSASYGPVTELEAASTRPGQQQQGAVASSAPRTPQGCAFQEGASGFVASFSCRANSGPFGVTSMAVSSRGETEGSLSHSYRGFVYGLPPLIVASPVPSNRYLTESSLLRNDLLAGKLLVNCTDSRLYVFDTPSSAVASGPSAVLSGHCTPPGNNAFYIRCAFSPDDEHAVCGSRDGKAYIWQARPRSESTERSTGE